MSLQAKARARPLLAFVCAIVLLVAVAFLGAHAWAAHHYHAALNDWRLYRLEEAKGHLDLALRIRPGGYGPNLLAARLARVHGDFAGAEKHLTACLADSGMTEELNVEWSLLRAQWGMFPEMENQLRRWVDERRPQSYLVLEALVYCLMQEGRLRLAHTLLDKWLQDHEDLPGPYIWRARVRDQLGRSPNQTRDDFTRALELSPDLWQARVRLVELLQDQTNFDLAEAHLQILEKSQPQRPEVWLVRGISDLGRNNAEGADAAFDRVLALTPEHPGALYFKGKLEMSKGHPEKAEPWLKRAVKADPWMAVARFALYLCQQQQPGREKDAAAQLETYRKNLATAQERDRLRQEVERQPNNPDAHVAIGEFLGKHGQQDLARQFFHRALQLQPGHAIAAKMLRDSINLQQ